MRTFIYLSTMVLLVGTLSCEHLCEAEDTATPNAIDFCSTLVPTADELPVAGFEVGTAHCQWLGSWKNGAGLEVEVMCQESAANGFLHLEIRGNNGDDPAGWTGGGIALPLSDCPDGINLQPYEFLAVDLRVQPGGHLHLSRIKLEDINRNGTAELPLQAYGELNDQWQSFHFPLNDFLSITNDLPDISRIDKLVTVAVHDLPTGPNIDGELDIDNIRFIR